MVDIVQQVSTDIVLSDKSEAEAGTNNTKFMTPLRTKEAIDKNLVPFNAMSQSQFEAIRAANNEEFAASGFVHMGKHRNMAGSPSTGSPVNEGLWCYYLGAGSENSFRIGIADGVANTEGKSKTQQPIVSIAGVIFELSQINVAAAKQNHIKFPQAPDGKTTYNKSTGAIVTHADSATAFAAQQADPTNVEVVIDRVDMWGFEAWLEEVNSTNPFVYPNGLIQSQATTMDGITTSASARPVTYYAVFDGDTGSKGKGVNFFTLTDAQKKKVLGNHKNNLYYLDDGRLVQWRLRQRTVAGAGNGDWQLLNDYNVIGFKGGVYLWPQGAKDSQLTFGSSSKLYVGDLDPNKRKVNNSIGIYQQVYDAATGLNGECYFLICGTVNRLNQGAYHPSFNSAGSRKFQHTTGDTSVFWYDGNAPTNITTIMCFNDATSATGGNGYRNNTGYIGSVGSGRPDGRFYDAIYADGQGGVCRDMRYSAYGLTPTDFAEADQRVKNGTYRGFEKAVFTKLVNHSAATQTHSFVKGVGASFIENFASASPSGKRLRINIVSGTSEASPYNSTTVENLNRVYLVGSNGSVCEFFSISYYINNGTYGYYGITTDTNLQTLVSDFDAKFPSGTTITVYRAEVYENKPSVGGSFLQTDIIGSPSNILATPQLANGWQGSWIPNFTSDYVTLSRKKIDAINTYNRIYTSNNGVSWATSSGTGGDAAANTMYYGGASVGSNRVFICQYQAFARQTENAVKRPVYGGASGISKVVDVQSWFDIGYGTTLVESCLGKILTNSNGNSSVVVNEGLAVTSITFDPDCGLHWYRPSQLPKHAALSLGSPLGSTLAMKSLSYDVNINQQANIQFIYTELKYNGTNWGDDGKVTIVDNQATKTDLNGNTVLVGTAKLKEPIGWMKNKV